MALEPPGELLGFSVLPYPDRSRRHGGRPTSSIKIIGVVKGLNVCVAQVL